MILSTCCCNSLLQHHCAEQKLCSLNRCSTGAIAFATKCLKSPVRFWWIYNEVYFLIRKASIVLILFLSFVCFSRSSRCKRSSCGSGLWNSWKTSSLSSLLTSFSFFFRFVLAKILKIKKKYTKIV